MRSPGKRLHSADKGRTINKWDTTLYHAIVHTSPPWPQRLHVPTYHAPLSAVAFRYQAPSHVMMELGRGLARGGEGLYRGAEAGVDRTKRAARWGLEAADDAAHAVGINRIPVLRHYLWGQVHTGFWNSYEVRCSGSSPPRRSYCPR